MRRIPLLILAAALSGTSLVAQRPARQPAADLDAYIARTMRTFEVPGMAVTIVKDGKVLLAKGYGIRRLGDTARVTADTRFGIASNSKAFTATALMKLADRGTIAIDSPVVKYLPDFALSDPYVTAHLTVRDLLVHRSGLGLGAGDLLWWPKTTYSRSEIMRRLRGVPLQHGFRERYAYDNVLYLVAGELIERVTGQSWEQHIQSAILDPLRMTHTTARHSDAAQPGNVAATHAKVDGTLTVVAPMTNDVTNAAGGINTTANDIARWMLTHLANGRTPDSVEVWRGWEQLQLWTGVTPMPVASPFDRKALRELGMPREMLERLASFSLYAPGFEVRDYRGQRIITHTGSLPGYVSRVTFVPALGLGVAVLTNQESTDAYDAITLRILDEQMRIGPTDWTTLFDSSATLLRQKMAEYRKEIPETLPQLDSALRKADRPPSQPLWRYIGNYEDPWYGTVTVDGMPGNDSTLVLRMNATPGMVGDVRHWEGDVFTVRWRDRSLRADAYIRFQLNRRGDIEGALMEPIDDEHTDFSFDFKDLRLKRGFP